MSARPGRGRGGRRRRLAAGRDDRLGLACRDAALGDVDLGPGSARWGGARAVAGKTICGATGPQPRSRRALRLWPPGRMTLLGDDRPDRGEDLLHRRLVRPLRAPQRVLLAIAALVLAALVLIASATTIALEKTAPANNRRSGARCLRITDRR